MINFLAQTESRGAASILESAPTDEIMVMCVVFIVFSTLLLVVVTYCVTSTVRAIRIASIQAQLIEKLVKQGVPHEQIEKLVKANRPGISLPTVSWPSRWRQPESRVSTPGKPAPLRS